MEIKIQCDCGQKFKFDAEPVNGRMPWEVNCPVCGLSGTDKANWIIAHAAPVPISAPLAPIGFVSSAPPAGIPIPPPPSAVPVAAPVPSAEAPKPKLSISRPHAAPAAVPPAATQSAVPRPMPRQVVASSMAKEPLSSNTLFFRGVLGAFGGAMLGMGIWYGIAVATGYQLGIVAWVVSPLVREEVAAAKLSVSAESRLAANSKLLRVRVEDSKKRLATTRPWRVGTFLTGRDSTSLKLAAV